MKIITVIGARPQFIKAAMVSRAIQEHNRVSPRPIEEYILHTGQHYDDNMSRDFFEEMQIPAPRWHLQCGNGTHGEMIGRMLIEIEKILIAEKPDYLLVYGDTDSTLAGALSATKLHIPVVHVEAGLRSFNKRMPEEINRRLTGHVATLHCCPTTAAVMHLRNEGIAAGIHHVGDVMYDAALVFGRVADASSDILARLHLESKGFALCTVHRAENTDNAGRLGGILNALKAIAADTLPIVFPLHPRTRKCLAQYGWLAELEHQKNIHLTPPLPFLDMVMLEKHAAVILTDSGGIQKEAYFHRTPCITLREETEWEETVAAGWNRIAGCKTEDILQCMAAIPVTERKEIPEFGDGHAAGRIVNLL